MSKLRVLLADDSGTVRRLLLQTLSADPELEVCRAARNGREAVEQFAVLRPDVVLLDVEMPEMDGIEATVAIRTQDSRVPIIMFSSLTTKGGEATLDALSHGATDFVTKPNCKQMHDAILHMQQQLIPKIKACGEWSRARRTPQPAASAVTTKSSAFTLQRAGSAMVPAPKSAAPNILSPRTPSLNVVAIGASTGGPHALQDVLKSLPARFPVPILITQHMPPLFTKLLAQRLDDVCPLTVREAVDGADLEPGQVWIAPGDQHLLVQCSRTGLQLKLDQGSPENSCRPAVDVMLRSIASVYGDRALAVVLTGMGQDGVIGCRLIREQGGRVLAQDQASSVVWGMPRAVTEAGLAERTLPLAAIGPEINRLVHLSHMTHVAV